MPIFRENLQREHFILKEKLDQIEYPQDKLTKTSLVIETCKKLGEFYLSEVGNDNADVALNEFNRGVRINQIMNKDYSHELDMIKFDEQLIISQLTYGQKNVSGTKNNLFMSNKLFFEVVKVQIGRWLIFLISILIFSHIFLERFREPTLNCVENVTEELRNIINKNVSQLKRFPYLRYVAFLKNCHNFYQAENIDQRFENK